MEEIKYNVKVDTKDVGKAESVLGKFGNNAKNTFSNLGQTVSGLGDKLGAMPGGIGAATGAFKGLGTSMMAIVMNPIGAIISAMVAIFMGLKEALGKSEKGMDAIAKVSAIFGAILNPIIQAVSEFAAMLTEGLAAALELVGSLFGDAAKEGREFAELQDELEDRELAMAEARATANKELAQARELLSDSNASLADRKKALDQVRKSEEDFAAKDLQFAKDKLKAAKMDQKLNGETEASKKAISAAVIEVTNAETDLAAKRRLFNKEAKKLDAEEEQRKKEAANAEKERLKELAAKQKEYADNRKSAREKIRDAEQKNIIDSIKDEELKARKQAEFDLASSLREIKEGKFTAKEKAKLKEEALEANVIKLAQITENADKKAKDTQKKNADEIKAFDQKAAEDEAKFIDQQFAEQELNIIKSITLEEDRINALNNLEIARLQNQIQARKDAGLSTTDLEKAIAAKEIDIAQKKTDKKKELDQKEFDNKLAMANATTGILTSLNSIIGDNAEFGKAIAVSQAVIDTYAGATKAFAQGGPLGFVSAGAVIAAGLANVQKILTTDVPSAGGGGGGGGGSNVGMPSISMVTPQTNSNAQLAGVLSDNAKKPTRAYVVGQDMNSQQSLDRHIKQNATF